MQKKLAAIIKTYEDYVIDKLEPVDLYKCSAFVDFESDWLKKLVWSKNSTAIKDIMLRDSAGYDDETSVIQNWIIKDRRNSSYISFEGSVMEPICHSGEVSDSHVKTCIELLNWSLRKTDEDQAAPGETCSFGFALALLNFMCARRESNDLVAMTKAKHDFDCGSYAIPPLNFIDAAQEMWLALSSHRLQWVRRTVSPSQFSYKRKLPSIPKISFTKSPRDSKDILRALAPKHVVDKICVQEQSTFCRNVDEQFARGLSFSKSPVLTKDFPIDETNSFLDCTLRRQILLSQDHESSFTFQNTCVADSSLCYTKETLLSRNYIQDTQETHADNTQVQSDLSHYTSSEFPADSSSSSFLLGISPVQTHNGISHFDQTTSYCRLRGCGDFEASKVKEYHPLSSYELTDISTNYDNNEEKTNIITGKSNLNRPPGMINCAQNSPSQFTSVLELKDSFNSKGEIDVSNTIPSETNTFDASKDMESLLFAHCFSLHSPAKVRLPILDQTIHNSEKETSPKYGDSNMPEVSHGSVSENDEITFKRRTDSGNRITEESSKQQHLSSSDTIISAIHLKQQNSPKGNFISCSTEENDDHSFDDQLQLSHESSGKHSERQNKDCSSYISRGNISNGEQTLIKDVNMNYNTRQHNQPLVTNNHEVCMTVGVQPQHKISSEEHKYDGRSNIRNASRTTNQRTCPQSDHNPIQILRLVRPQRGNNRNSSKHSTDMEEEASKLSNAIQKDEDKYDHTVFGDDKPASLSHNILRKSNINEKEEPSFQQSMPHYFGQNNQSATDLSTYSPVIKATVGIDNVLKQSPFSDVSSGEMLGYCDDELRHIHTITSVQESPPVLRYKPCGLESPIKSHTNDNFIRADTSTGNGSLDLTVKLSRDHSASTLKRKPGFALIQQNSPDSMPSNLRHSTTYIGPKQSLYLRGLEERIPTTDIPILRFPLSSFKENIPSKVHNSTDPSAMLRLPKLADKGGGIEKDTEISPLVLRLHLAKPSKDSCNLDRSPSQYIQEQFLLRIQPTRNSVAPTQDSVGEKHTYLKESQDCTGKLDQSRDSTQEAQIIDLKSDDRYSVLRFENMSRNQEFTSPFHSRHPLRVARRASRILKNLKSETFSFDPSPNDDFSDDQRQFFLSSPKFSNPPDYNLQGQETHVEEKIKPQRGPCLQPTPQVLQNMVQKDAQMKYKQLATLGNSQAPVSSVHETLFSHKRGASTQTSYCEQKHRVVQTGQDIAHAIGVDGFSVATQTMCCYRASDATTQTVESESGTQSFANKGTLSKLFGFDSTETDFEDASQTEVKIKYRENNGEYADIGSNSKSNSEGICESSKKDMRDEETQTHNSKSSLYEPFAVDLDSAISVQLCRAANSTIPQRKETHTGLPQEQGNCISIPFINNQTHKFASVRSIHAPNPETVATDFQIYESQRRNQASSHVHK